MRKANNFGDDLYIFLIENDPQTSIEAVTFYWTEKC